MQNNDQMEHYPLTRSWNIHNRGDTMCVGTDLLVHVFETFAAHHTPQKTFRRLFCESGQAAIKAYRYANNNTKQKLDEIIPKCSDCQKPRMKTRTIVLVFEELTKIKEPELLKEMYVNIGGPSRNAYLVCNKKTQRIIQKLELYKK